MDTKKDIKNKLMLALIVFLVAVIIALVVLLITLIVNAINGKSKNQTTVADEYDTVAEQVTEEATGVLEDAANEEETKKKILICAPADTMQLYKMAGDEDGILTMCAGNYLTWDEETTTVDKDEYYKVVDSESNLEGWVKSSDVISVDFEETDNWDRLTRTNIELYTYDMMVEDIEKLCNKYPGILSYEIIGASRMDKDIYAVTLGNPNAKHHIMMQASIHGREYVNSRLVIKMLAYYAYHYNTATYNGISYSDLFNNTAIHVVTMSNPDGVTIAQLGVEALEDDVITAGVITAYQRDKDYLVYEENSNGDMNWMDHYNDPKFKRSNYPGASRMITWEEYQTLWKANAYAVDLNNNFDADWDNINLKSQPSYGSFKGVEPVSEPETQALVNYANKRDYDYYISYHSTGQLIYYDCKGNDAGMSDTEYDFASFMNSKIKYKLSNTTSAYNVNLGGFGDWIQLSKKKPSLTIESGKKPCPVPNEEFSSIWIRHRESWAALCNELYLEN